MDLVEGRATALEVPWKARHGDDLAWADPLLDDSDWASGDPLLSTGPRPTIGWEGIGWFRLRFEVVESAAYRPLILGVRLAGAAEIYLDGRRIGSFGRVANDPDEAEEVFLSDLLWLTLDPGEHLLAVRLSCHHYGSLVYQRRFAGLWLRLR